MKGFLYFLVIGLTVILMILVYKKNETPAVTEVSENDLALLRRIAFEKVIYPCDKGCGRTVRH